MRITNSHRGHTTNLAKCTKMTEGEHRIHGMNGVTDSGSAAIKEESPQSSQDTYNHNLGGRLKFFKNGRFILELARAQEGEKVAWVPVPKKTFWPPQGSASSLSTYRQESSTSLSVSDDNSSVQSSPWQRDHTWKQASPQRNISTQLSFYYCRGRVRRASPSCFLHHLQRSPYTSDQWTKCRGNQCNNPRCVSNNTNSAISTITNSQNGVARASLVQIVQILWNKSLQALNSITSPRKRILRELERVTIDDLSSYNKRCRGKVPPQQTRTSASSVPTENNSNSSVIVTASSAELNGGTISVAKNCSYSITSLLGSKLDTIRDEKLSSSQYISPSAAASVSKITSTSTSTATSTTANLHHHQQQRTATALDDISAQDTVDGPIRNATTEIMTNKIARGSPSAPGDTYSYPPAGAHHPYMSPYALYPPVLPPQSHAYISPYYSTMAAAAASYARGAPPSGFYSPLGPPMARHEHPAAPYAWPVPASTYEHPLQRDESDVPLNLSKHAD